MKKLLVLSSISMLLLSGCAPKDEYKHLLTKGKANIILIIGQSNASGNSPSEFLENKEPDIYSKYKVGNEKVLTNYYVHVSNYINYFEPTRFGMADAKNYFGPEIGIADVFNNVDETTYIIKYAIGGSTLDNEWLDTNGNRGRYYNDSINWFKEKLEYLKSNGVEPNIVGQFWMQGEGDSHSGLEIKYESNERNLIEYYREDLKDYYQDHYLFVDAYISTKTTWPSPDKVNEGKQKVADSDPYVYCIKTNGEDDTALDLNLKKSSGEGDDAAHYDSISQLKLGQEVGRIIKENI